MAIITIITIITENLLSRYAVSRISIGPTTLD